MAMTITGGALKGRRINSPTGKTRPTSAKLRQALFDILGDIEGMSFCDLFAGTGVVGIEALSRGARHVEFVESDARAFRGIISNLGELGIARESAQVRKMPVARWLASASSKHDIIFADPPFIDAVIDGFLAMHAQILPRVAPGGILAVQLPSRRPLVEFSAERRKFGDDTLNLLVL
ncbi:MAG TPA: 16S rRNA (guanine(966)-N(2))-methyltransferase RsmD [candidate division Zixibacteria bacterium]|nr:16S rRNA (guanine(966)-N(2))-methyltransferase RsmD [candidate division Zixibacteria bacterium]